MSSQLSGWIKTKFGGTIAIHEANQLIFALYLSVGCLPDDLRHLIWDRAALVGEFVALVREGNVRGTNASHRETQYWSSVIDQILLDQNKFDQDFFSQLYAPR
jgi:hypothetical protein